jgi:hypothetical protein
VSSFCHLRSFEVLSFCRFAVSSLPSSSYSIDHRFRSRFRSRSCSHSLPHSLCFSWSLCPCPQSFLWIVIFVWSINWFFVYVFVVILSSTSSIVIFVFVVESLLSLLSLSSLPSCYQPTFLFLFSRCIFPLVHIQSIDMPLPLSTKETDHFIVD